MHVHTWYSDSSGSVREVLEVAQRKGLDGIALTDHETLQGAYEAVQENNKLVIVPGIEVETTQGEILALGVRKLIPRRLPLIKALKNTCPGSFSNNTSSNCTVY
jgi:predicted metal-dependent phosphoesterase TrpH